MLTIQPVNFILVISLAACAVADDGDDFSNNLISDLAPLLALFGEKVTTQFMSQSVGWADNIILAVAPLGILTAIVSAIRVGGPTWLKTVIGRARENRAVAESELMSSTSHEVCELWNDSDLAKTNPPFLPEPSLWERLLGGGRPKGGSRLKLANGTKGATREQPTNSRHDSRSERSDSKQKAQKAPQTRDPEKALPMLGSQELPALQNKTAEGDPPSKKRLVAVIRNTDVSTPNLTLNIHSQISRRELYAIALFGVILQLGILVYFGIAAELPALKYALLKDDNVVARYALPCAVIGTVLLVASMLICAHVVESSTLETSYRPVEGVEARVVWLQRSGTVNDQAFDSFAIFPAQSQAVITTSRRAPRRKLALLPPWAKKKGTESTIIDVEHIAAVCGSLVGICGFIVQFVGLRSMHWSASAAQLGATIAMTILRASVRRNLSINPQSQPLIRGHEMDWLALALGDSINDSDSWLKKRGRPWDWRVVAVEDPGRSEKLKQQFATASTEISGSISHRATLTRRDLGALADWYGSASPEAIALARAIEATLDAFGDLIDRDGKDFYWSLPALKPFGEPNHEPIVFRVERQEGGNWVAYADELEAAWSLWQYSVHEQENPTHSGLVDEARKDKEVGRRLKSKPPRQRGDEWLRSKGSLAKRSVRLLSSYNHGLYQDLRLWMPDGSVRVIGVEQNDDKSTDESRVIEIESHRILGHASGWTVRDSDSGEDNKKRLTKVPLPGQDSAPDETTTHTIIATESYSALKTLFVHHLFATFMWTMAKTIEKPIADSADIRITEVDETNGDLRRRSFALHTSRLSKLAQDIQTTGLGGLEDVYLCILPALSIENKLPPSCKHTKDVNGRTPLHLVAATGSEADVKRVVELGADKNARDDRSQTPLHVAIANGNLAVVKAVVNLGADIEARTSDGWTPLATAARHGHADLRRRPPMSGTPLVLAARYGHTGGGRTAAEIWCKPLTRPPAGDGHRSFKRRRKGKRARPGCWFCTGRTRRRRILPGRTPLHGAASKGITGVVKALVELKADIEARDNFNGTPLHWAAAGGHAETVRALVGLGANKESRVSGGWIPHYEAIVAGDQNMKSIAGEDEGSGGQTPMHLAAMNGHGAVIKILIEVGADTNARDRYRRTPQDWAIEEGRAEVVELLR
ncbi:hypothetical protein CHGG_00233 [Chaetomium globosum CBS 148.51]|uniref:Uncharacterized protein n=1 Tax=Chaetomium globosum (strain ATCC 6205 / CBS 148.51 / DSM 1962 / NBRC 6347 / NRRL 1970) TaxID=306901 RepID=Q2HHS1_CHAGB|nr:uncharacterized protein CHGG_00233 [Chaetomium globosum CBS 148.51]EAQ91998.1 hypothetical protein CHGG_00233 [Chaetomium globosum CBS 148.51]